MTLKKLLLQIYENVQTLEERRATYGNNVPLDLLNQIEDHYTAIKLIEEALESELAERDLQTLKAELRPLIIARNVENIDLDRLKLEKPRLPFEPETVLVSGGSFMMGSLTGDNVSAEEIPQHEVKLPDFRIGKYQITNVQYLEFIKRNLRQVEPKYWSLREPPVGKFDHPVVAVNWHDAQAYCRWLSLETERVYRLPTEVEWEKAASWAEGQKRIYPWGDDFEAGRANTKASGLGGTSPVGSYSPQGDSFYSCADMAGNAQEWTSTLWGTMLQQTEFPYPYRGDDGREDLAADERLHRVFRIHRGGAFRDNKVKVRATARGVSDPDSKISWRGFRVVLEV